MLLSRLVCQLVLPVQLADITSWPRSHLRLVKSADRLKQAKIAVDASAAVITMAGLTASAMPTRGPIEVPWQKANVPSSA